ncbi:hypothetical protein BS297_20710 [Rhodococcus erythropolis]|uniref:Uncharacterized protein n=1 Tax=Rhodococcus erythropolis TaxID=1833 RepID=A0A5N5DZ58_RHOER|nr:hypothetical protein BS297_20710 [Rhodococcus erythropolis]
MTYRDNDVHDVRELLGLRTIAAKTVVTAFVATFALVAWSTNPPGGGWFEFAAWIVVSIGAVGLIGVPGDPLAAPATAYLTLSGPIAVNLIFVVVPVPIDGLLQLWPLAASTAIYTYMCVRGRTVWAWIGMAAVLASCILWAERTGQSAAYGLSMSAINLAPLLMATFFAWTIRPAAREIFALRRQATLRIAAEAADTAVLDERDAQLTRLDDLARPLLERITDADPLTGQERLDCQLLEAHLRDTLRAPTLAVPHIAAEARAARTRGVEVILLDDHALDTASEEVRDRVIAAAADALITAHSGSLTIRILPPDRDVLATILHSTREVIVRVEYDPDGQPLAPRI